MSKRKVIACDLDGTLAHYDKWPADGSIGAPVPLAWLRKHEPERVIIAPWIASILAGEDDFDPAQRERGMLDAEELATRVDGIVLCGGRISSGMGRECIAVCRAGGIASDLTSLGEEPPDVWPTDEFGTPIEHGLLPIEHGLLLSEAQ